MNYRLMFTINAIVAAAAGALLLLVPQPFLHFFGMTDAPISAQLIARFFGGALIVIAALLWFIKDGGKELLRTTALTMMAASVVGVILVVLGMAFDKVLRGYAWILLVIYILLAAGYAYVIFGVTVKVKAKK